MNSEILFQFLFENSEIIFDKPKKLVWDGACRAEYAVKMFVQFGLLESISDESKAIGDD